jgi:ribosomal protein S3
MGENGANINRITKELNRISKRQRNIKVNIVEVKNPDLEPKLLAE